MKKSVKSLKNKAWKLYTKRIKETRPNVCVTCGKTNLSGRDCQVGHYWNKKFYPFLYFNPINTQIQCYRCNIWAEGEKQKFRKYILENYGPKELERLDREAEIPFKWTIELLESLILDLKQGLYF